jgi:tetratricopeptide (TPR) repeat protein
MSIAVLEIVLALALAPQAGGQIAWQTDLDAAAALARDEQRPLFVALNMDGESASERIVREQYRDPAFVALAGRAVCVIGSVFRHNPRDFDDHGRRVECPRLGAVTCREHIALEPLIFERYLGGERIAPRHALVMPGGEKAFDLFLLFDLKQLEEALAQGVAGFDAPARPLTARPPLVATWRKLFATQLANPTVQTKTVLEQLGKSATGSGFGPAAAAVVRERLFDCDKLPVGVSKGPAEGLLALLADLDPAAPATIYALLGQRVVSSAAATKALAKALPPDVAAEVEAAIEAEGGAIDFNLMLTYARAARVEGLLAPSPAPRRPSAREAGERLAAALEAQRQGDAAAPAVIREVGVASLQAARARIDEGGDGIPYLLADAKDYLERAAAALPDDLALQLELARLAFVEGRFEDQERIALAVLGRLPPLPPLQQAARADVFAMLTADPVRQDALRFVGDAAARLVNARYSGDVAVQAAGLLRGARAWSLAVLSPTADAVDYQSAISFFDVLGLRAAAILLAEEAALRFESAIEPRDAVRAVCGKLGRPELAVDFAQREVTRKQDSADAAWHLGFDLLRLADWRRRMEAPDAAIEVSQRAIAEFRRAAERNPDYAGSCAYQMAFAAQGMGFAHLLALRQEEAAAALVEAVAFDPRVRDERDGLDRETVDLIDQVLEWRAGRPSPVAALAWLEQLEAAAPEDSFYARAICDALLREALRAEGRGDGALADRYLEESLNAGERAVARAPDGDDERLALAQCATIAGERMLARGEPGAARDYLARAAPLLDFEMPTSDDPAALETLAAALRERLGEARPQFRPGR